jgi:hypothetical protein
MVQYPVALSELSNQLIFKLYLIVTHLVGKSTSEDC